MSRTVRLSRCTRWVLAVLIFGAVLAELAIVGAVPYARMTRVHEVVEVADNNTIVQVLVNCRLAAVERQAGSAEASMNLGWLPKDAVVTIQVRGWRPFGRYKVAVDRNSVPELVADSGAKHVPIDRFVLGESMTASGHRLGSPACQSDAPEKLLFATSASGRWEGPPGASIELAARLAPVVPWMLACVGAITLAALAVSEWRRRHRVDGTIASAILAALGSAVSVGAMTSDHFRLAFGVCVAVGVCSLVALGFWLVADDLRTICARLLDRWDRHSEGRVSASPG